MKAYDGTMDASVLPKVLACFESRQPKLVNQKQSFSLWLCSDVNNMVYHCRYVQRIGTLVNPEYNIDLRYLNGCFL
jgi:hypothetical protein